MSGRPRFSVVIPTRERARTLAFALATCVEQEFDDYEVLVCDNCSAPATREVVEAAASPRVRYVRAPEPLAMRDNWELAVSEARGEFVIVLGDDDGLMPYALAELDGLIGRLGARVIRWTAAFYTWPDVALPGQGDYLRLPLGRRLRMLEAPEAIASVIRFEAPYIMLPMLYNSAIHRDLIAELRQRAGRVFANAYPDVYSGFALGYLAGRYPSIDVPMTVAGSSGDSYGVATLFLRGASERDRDSRELDAKGKVPHHRWSADFPVFPAVPVADSFQMAKEALFPGDDRLALDRRLVTIHCMGGLRVQTEAEWWHARGCIRASLEDNPALIRWFDDAFGGALPTLERMRLRPAALGYDGEFLHLDTKAFGVADVRAAVALSAMILNHRAGAIDDATTVAPASLEMAEGVAQLQVEEHALFRLLVRFIRTKAAVKGALLRRLMAAPPSPASRWPRVAGRVRAWVRSRLSD